MLRSLVILAAACFLTATAAAQPAPDQSAPLPPASSRQCSDLPRDKDITRDDVAFAQACQETLRLQQENLRLQVETDRLKAETESIKLNNSNRIWSVLAALGPLFGAVIALIPVGLGFMAKSGSERRLLEVQNSHARIMRRDQQVQRLLDDLSGDSPARQSFAAAGMFSLIHEDMEATTGALSAPERQREAVMLITALFARLRDKALGLAEVKFISDELHKVFTMPSKFKLRLGAFNLQQVRLIKAYWAKADASGADLYEADLAGASFRGANLEGAALYGSNLDGAVFKGANLKGANFTGALNIDKGLFDNTTQWSAATIWPAGFNPTAAGLGPASA